MLQWEGREDAPVVLFLHANSLCAGAWVPVVRRISKEIRAVAVDLRGHGGADAPAGREAYRWSEFGQDFQRIVAAVAAEIGRPVDACVTHSFIGDCALLALADRPLGTDLKRLVMLDPVLADEEGATVGAQRLAKGTRRLGEREAAGFDSGTAVGEGLEKLLRGALATGSLHEEAKAAYAQFGAFCDAGGRWRLKCSRENEADVYANRVAIADYLQTRTVATEATLIFSRRRRGKPEDQDATFARDMATAERVVARCRQGSAVQLLDGVGHFLVLEDPGLVAGALDALL